MDYFRQIGAVIAIVFITFLIGAFLAMAFYYVFVGRCLMKIRFSRIYDYLLDHGRGKDEEENYDILERELTTRIRTVNAVAIFYAALYAMLVFALYRWSSRIDIPISALIGLWSAVYLFYVLIKPAECRTACAIGKVTEVDDFAKTATLEYGNSAKEGEEPKPYSQTFDFKDNPELFKLIKMGKGKIYCVFDYIWAPSLGATDVDEWSEEEREAFEKAD